MNEKTAPPTNAFSLPSGTIIQFRSPSWNCCSVIPTLNVLPPEVMFPSLSIWNSHPAEFLHVPATLRKSPCFIAWISIDEGAGASAGTATFSVDTVFGTGTVACCVSAVVATIVVGASVVLVVVCFVVVVL